MRDLINSIIDRNFTEANNLLEEHLSYITVVKLEEAKKMCAAKMSVEHQSLNEDDVEEAVDPKDNSLDVEKGPAQPDKNVTVLHKTDTNKTVIHKNNLKESDDLGPVDKRKGESQEYEHSESGKKIRSTRHPGKEWKLVNEQMINRDTKSSSPAFKQADQTWTNRVITGKPVDSSIGSSLARDDMTPSERMSANKTQRINTQLRTPPPREGGYIDARTNKPYVPPKAEQMPLRGPTTQGSSQVNRAGKGDRPIPNSPVTTNPQQNKTTVQKVNEEETLEEARFRIVKARIRGGKIQRRKKISNVPGYRMQGSTLQRMSPAERRRRKMGARRAKIKRRSKINRTLMKRQRSIRRRKALGL
jgi:hypothetical protein